MLVEIVVRGGGLVNAHREAVEMSSNVDLRRRGGELLNVYREAVGIYRRKGWDSLNVHPQKIYTP